MRAQEAFFDFPEDGSEFSIKVDIYIYVCVDFSGKSRYIYIYRFFWEIYCHLQGSRKKASCAPPPNKILIFTNKTVKMSKD